MLQTLCRFYNGNTNAPDRFISALTLVTLEHKMRRHHLFTQPLTGEVLIYRSRRRLARGDGVDHEPCAMCEIARHKNVVCGCLERVGIDL